MKLIRGIIENLMLCNVNMSNNPVRYLKIYGKRKNILHVASVENNRITYFNL